MLYGETRVAHPFPHFAGHFARNTIIIPVVPHKAVAEVSASPPQNDFALQAWGPILHTSSFDLAKEQCGSQTPLWSL